MASTNTDLHITLLEKIKDNGFGKPIDISRFLDDSFPNRLHAGIMFISELIDKKLIYFEGDINLSDLKKRFSETEINVYSLTNNIDYLRSRYSQQDAFRSNDFIRRSLKKQTYIFLATAIFAFLAFVVSAIGLYRQFYKDTLKQELSIQQREVKILSIQNSRLRTDSALTHETGRSSDRKP